LLTPCVAWIVDEDAMGAVPAEAVSKLTVRTVELAGDVTVVATGDEVVLEGVTPTGWR
jgi:hypothetical protein